ESAYARALPLIAAARPELTAAWLPVALVPLYLRALDRPAQEPSRLPDVSAFRKVWALWRAARNGRPAAP
ncbi:MAG: hypothetical protein QOC56_1688, partial [Alphaproteobacteria bacterium]|nr:hypothetical protein [Alphaproteobacteria bacterium]